MTDALQGSSVNRYLAHKQHLLPASHLADVVQVTRPYVPAFVNAFVLMTSF